MMLIGVAGPARSGKDTIGAYLVAEYGFTRVSFADPIKNMVATLLNVSVEWINNETNKEELIPGVGYSPRHLLQTIGTEWARNTLDESFWIRVAERQIDRFAKENFKGVVITDCRFPNEAEMIRTRQGMIWHVERPGYPTVQNHASETGILIDKFTDWNFANSDSISALHDQIDLFFQHSPL